MSVFTKMDYSTPHAAPTLPADHSQYLLRSRPEIIHILRALEKTPELVTGYVDSGEKFFLTSVIRVDPHAGNLYIDQGPDAHINALIRNGASVTFVSFQDKVKVQFSPTEMETSSVEGRPAFVMPIPEELFKFQRREYYRLVTPIAKPIVCLVPTRYWGTVSATLLDISVGGVGLAGLPTDFVPDFGESLENCTLLLPDTGNVVVNLEIRNSLEFTNRSGGRSRRYGCQFVSVNAHTQALIQKFITRLERERLARLTEA